MSASGLHASPAPTAAAEAAIPIRACPPSDEAEASKRRASQAPTVHSPTLGADPPPQPHVSPGRSAKMDAKSEAPAPDAAPPSPDSDGRSPPSTSPLLPAPRPALAVREGPSIETASAFELDEELGVSASESSVTTNAEVCVICVSRVKNKRTLDCGHAFCADCIATWLIHNPTCPSCRRRFVTADSNHGSGPAASAGVAAPARRPWYRTKWTVLICVATFGLLLIAIIVWLIGKETGKWS